jgi:hypothetical protein
MLVKRLRQTNNNEQPMVSEDVVMADCNEEMTRKPRIGTLSEPNTPMVNAYYRSSAYTDSYSQYNSYHQLKSKVCAGITPVYHAPFDTWGYGLI